MSPRTTIVFPPAADPSLPYGALPLLGAVLRRAGYDVHLRDLNLEAFEDLLRPEALQREADRLAQPPAWAADAIAHGHEAPRVRRDPRDFYRPERLLFAKHTFPPARGLRTVHH